jgi:hypothetical protein
MSLLSCCQIRSYQFSAEAGVGHCLKTAYRVG